MDISLFHLLIADDNAKRMLLQFRNMERTKFSFAVFISLLLLLGIAVGFWLTSLWTSTPPGTPGKAPSKNTPMVFPPGFCCMKSAGKCVEESGGAVACLKKGGKVFNQKQADCDRTCSRILQ